jgi:hypothetical protein
LYLGSSAAESGRWNQFPGNSVLQCRSLHRFSGFSQGEWFHFLNADTAKATPLLWSRSAVPDPTLSTCILEYSLALETLSWSWLQCLLPQGWRTTFNATTPLPRTPPVLFNCFVFFS